MRLPKHLLLLSSTLLIGCASNDDGRTEEVTVLSKPKGAMVEVNGTRIGRTPITVELDRSRNHELILDKSGFEASTTVLRPTLRKDTYGFGGKVVVELDPEGTNKELSEAERAEFRRVRASSNAPMGIDAAIWGTTQGDLAEARLSARKLAELAALAKADAERSQADLAAALANLRQDPSATDEKMVSAETELRNAVEAARTAERKLAAEQEIVRQRIAAIEAAESKGEPVAPQAKADLTAAREAATEAEAAVVANRAAIEAATAALAAATEARQADAGQQGPAGAEAALEAARKRGESAAALEANVAASVANLNARIEELAKAIAEGGGGAVAEAQAQADAARRETAELRVALEATKAVSANEAAAGAEQRLAEANGRVAELERRLANQEAEAALAAEVGGRALRERAYAEYTARKGLIERALRSGELSREAYRVAIEQLAGEERPR